MMELIKFITAVFLIGIVMLVGYWTDQYKNIFPRCDKYAEEDFFWICSRNRGKICDKTKEYQIDNNCVHYSGKIVCGNFEIERGESLYCEDWSPWFNRKHTIQTTPLPEPPKEEK